MSHINQQRLDRELKKGSAELLILSLLEARARHGYEIRKLIETRSDGVLKFNAASLYPLLYRLEKRGWIEGKWVEKAGVNCRPVWGQNTNEVVSLIRRPAHIRKGDVSRGI
jgi:hypothetical protein